MPTTIFVHGFLTRDGRRMSKSLGTGVDPVGPRPAPGVWTPSATGCSGTSPPTGDADFSDDAFAGVYAAELADDLGNLVSRVVGMLHRYRAGVIPEPAGSVDPGLRAAAARLSGRPRAVR